MYCVVRRGTIGKSVQVVDEKQDISLLWPNNKRMKVLNNFSRNWLLASDQTVQVWKPSYYAYLGVTLSLWLLWTLPLHSEACSTTQGSFTNYGCDLHAYRVRRELLACGSAMRMHHLLAARYRVCLGYARAMRAPSSRQVYLPCCNASEQFERMWRMVYVGSATGICSQPPMSKVRRVSVPALRRKDICLAGRACRILFQTWLESSNLRLPGSWQLSKLIPLT